LNKIYIYFFRIHLPCASWCVTSRSEKPTSAINSVYRSDRYNFTDARRWHRAKVQADTMKHRTGLYRNEFREALTATKAGPMSLDEGRKCDTLLCKIATYWLIIDNAVKIKELKRNHGKLFRVNKLKIV